MERRARDMPCERCPKSRDGKPNPGAEMTASGWRAYRYWLASRSGLQLPADGLTRAAFAAIQLAHDHAARRAALANEAIIKAMTRVR